MKLSDRQFAFLKDVSLLIEYSSNIGIKLTGGELYRTKYQQEKYIKDGKSKTMKSKHLSRLAIDFNFFIDGKLTYDKKKVQVLGDFWESLSPNNSWGGNWKSFVDTPHFQRSTK